MMSRRRKSAFKIERTINNFFKKVIKTDHCWLWNAGKNKAGYGRFWVQNKFKMAHRFSYELERGAIPEGLQLDHLCRVPACVNPYHLDPVTARENQLRSPLFQGHKTHCEYGHPFSQENTKITARGYRECRQCRFRLKEKWKSISREQRALNPAQPKTHCIRGHELSGINIRINSHGARVCLLCPKEMAERIYKIIGPTRSQDHCINGHKYTKENSRIRKDGYRICVTCIRKTANLPPHKDRTRCKNGHRYTKETIYLNPRGIKECRICRDERSQKRYQKIIQIQHLI